MSEIKNNYIDETDLLTILAENIDKVDFARSIVSCGFHAHCIASVFKILHGSVNTVCADADMTVFASSAAAHDLNITACKIAKVFNVKPDVIFYEDYK